MSQPVWKILSDYDLPTAPLLADDLDLALAAVAPNGAVLHISRLGKQRWGWDEGACVPETVLEALGTVKNGAPHALTLRQGGLSLIGFTLKPEQGWLLVGYAAEASQTLSASRFKSLIENVPVLMLRMRADGTVLSAEADADSLTGYAVEQIVGQAFLLDIVHPEDRWKLMKAMRGAAEDEQRTTLNVRLLTRHQALRFARLHLLPREEGEIDVLVFDRAEQEDIEEVLLQSEALYRTFLEQSPMGILHLDGTGVVTFENHAFRQIVGEEADDSWIGHSMDGITGLDPELGPFMERMLRDGTPMHGQALMYRRRGADWPVYLVVHGSPIRQPGGQIVGGVLMVEDVTEQRLREDELLLRDRYERAEMALREAVLGDLNEEVFLHEAASILGETTGADRIHILVHLGDEGHCITRAAWVQNEQDDPFSLYVYSGDSPALRRAVVEGESVHVRAGEMPEARQVLLDLTEAEEVRWTPFYDAGRLGGFILFERTLPPLRGVAGFWQEHEQRLMDHLVRLFETLWAWIQVGRRYRQTVAAIDDCLFTFSYAADQTRRYLFITPQIEALAGIPAEAILARSKDAADWVEDYIYSEDRVQVLEHDQALHAGRESSATYRIERADGTIRWLCEHATPHRDASGRVTVSGILMDVTEQKDAEAVLQSAEEQVRSASRLKNSFVSTMSHELRTPLGAINGFAELLALELDEWAQQQETSLPPQISEFIDAVRQNAKRVLRLADDLFVLSNMEMNAMRVERAPVPLHPIVHQCMRKVTVLLAEKDVHLELDLSNDELVVLGDAQRLAQVVDNLLSNAAKFTEAGQVTVHTRRSEEGAVLEVRDTGVGIDPVYMDQLFTPFLQEDSRLNRRYQGTGLGLALVKRLVDLMGGRIEVESEKGKGTTFRVVLPVAA